MGEKSQFKWPTRYERLSQFRGALDTFLSRKTDFNQTQIVEEIRKVSARCHMTYTIDTTVFSKAINGDTERHLGSDLSKPYGLLWLTIVFMIGRTHSVIPNHEALHTWLYEFCPGLFINDDGRDWIERKAPQFLESMDIPWPVPEVDTETSVPSIPVDTGEVQALPALSAKEGNPPTGPVLVIFERAIQEAGSYSYRAAAKVIAMVLENVRDHRLKR